MSASRDDLFGSPLLSVMAFVAVESNTQCRTRQDPITQAGAAINEAEQALLPLLFMSDVHSLDDDLVASALSNVPKMLRR
ncbi:hypothetical protein LZ31DRAFT_635244 [Colletotrichum somersetense]|nr:hypothetical protein LZ31DRAFT_635244 [Colletotrichum somersetense]